MDYSDLKWALEVLGITLNFKKIKDKYKKLIKENHPDLNKGKEKEAQENTARINRAFEILSEYHDNYKMDFSEDEFYKQYPEALMKRMLKNDPFWGNNY
ncbi:MAG: molecular chaperone DnaJ [Bacteroidetes bacterium]|nr:MAG: molecular chaperone DnaJ [Bacteroidota bacterium]